MKSDLEKFRTRWNRWLGQKTRHDRDSWVDLINTNWTGWAHSVFTSHGIAHPSCDHSLTGVYIFYSDAIRVATMKELLRLDNLYATEKYN